MTFEEILDQAVAMLQRRGRLTYGTLKRQFHLDDAALDDLKAELLYAHRLAGDDGGAAWSGPVRQPGHRRLPHPFPSLSRPSQLRSPPASLPRRRPPAQRPRLPVRPSADS